MPALMSAAVMTGLRVTSTPLSLRAPAVSSVVMVTDCRVLPVSTSVKPKSLTLRTRAVSSTAVRMRLLAVGASLTAVTLIVAV